MLLGKTVWMFVVLSLVMAGCTTESGDGCSGSDKSCELKCTANTDCAAGLLCDTATQHCVDRALGCRSTSDCLAQEICHPTAKVCVRTCTAASDCPDNAKSCAAVSATNTKQVCQCATDALCNEGRVVANLVCSSMDKVCTPQCTADADCDADRKCDTATGQCKDALKCSIDADCRAQEICHPKAKVCVQTCASSVDCPDSAKTCYAVSATDTRMVCLCSTDTLCNAFRVSSDLVCSVQDHVCAPRCTTNEDCGSGRICDTATGQCKPG